MILLGIDFETTGVDPQTCLPLEVGFQTYDTKTRKRGPAGSKLIWEDSYPPITEKISELTGLTADLFTKPYTREEIFFILSPIIEKVDMLTAYNATFDRGVLEKLCSDVNQPWFKKPWLCSMQDLPWPESMQKCKKLTHRALDMGLPMDNRIAHRAFADVNTMFDIFDCWDMEEVLEYHRIPNVFIRADVRKPWEDDGKSVGKAREHGFSWETPLGESSVKFSKQWVKKVKETFDPKEYPFPVQMLIHGEFPHK